MHDVVANSTRTMYHTTGKVALLTSADGDCLFNAFSICLTGDESRSVEMRYRCCVEMVSCPEKVHRHRAFHKLDQMSPDYDADCVQCTKSGSFSSVWRIMALSNHLKIPVDSVFPAVNGTRNIYFKSLNVTFRPPFAAPEKGRITIMWTNTRQPPANSFVRKAPTKKEWYPNHFVPLVNVVPSASSSTVKVNALPTVAPPTSTINVSAPPTSLSTVHVSAPPSPTVDVNAPPKVVPRKKKTTPPVVPNVPFPITKSPHNEPVIVSPFSSPNIYCHLGIETEGHHDSPFPSPKLNLVDNDNDVSTHTTNVKPDKTENKCEITHVSPLPPPSTYSRVDRDIETIMENNSSCSAPKMDYAFKLPTISEVSETISDNPYELSFCERNSDMDDSAGERNDEHSDLDDSNEDIEFTPGPLGNNFMDIHTTIDTLKRPLYPLPEIPNGRKDGMYFLVNNVSNSEKRQRGGRCEFWDDCGAWKNASSPTTMYVQINDKLISVTKRDGLYCTQKQVDRKKTYVPLLPQPADSDVLYVHRLYQTLSASPTGKKQFKRRVSWFGNIPQSYQLLSNSSNVAIVEYIGTFPPRQCHGHVKHLRRNGKFIRTKPSVTNELKMHLKHESVKTVERKMNNKTRDDFEKQRNDKQLRNIRYIINKDDNSKSCSNTADNIISVEEMTKTGNFVQSVKHINGLQHPVVTLFNDQQITDIKRFCCTESGTVLGVDKTYNLGDFHVTPTVYKDLSVIRRTPTEGNESGHPICIGPTYIHTSSTTKTYSSFFHDIADNLSPSELNQLTVGSDEELAFKCSISRCLIGSTHVLCTRHLKQNANKQMEDKVGLPMKDRQEILNKIFGDDGIVSARDIDTYTTRVTRLRDMVDAKDKNEKKFRPYLDEKLLPLLEKHVIEPARKGKVTTNWTNNNSESVNHVIKSATNWKLQDLPKFISTLENIILNEQMEKLRAIRDSGNYVLDTKFIHHLVDIDHWTNLTDEQQARRERRFMTDKGKSNPNLVISTDGTRTLLKTPTAGKKPHQVKRKRAERSVTPNSKRRLIKC